jgi:hypothetical protein
MKRRDFINAVAGMAKQSWVPPKLKIYRHYEYEVTPDGPKAFRRYEGKQ